MQDRLGSKPTDSQCVNTRTTTRPQLCTKPHHSQRSVADFMISRADTTASTERPSFPGEIAFPYVTPRVPLIAHWQLQHVWRVAQGTCYNLRRLVVILGARLCPI